MSEGLEHRAADLPPAPGVYLFRDEAGEVIYVGKARSLRNRVRSYFGSAAALNTRTLKMLNAAVDLETIVTDNELEALILESNLIKRHRPKYNIRLRDDKQYPYVAVTTGEEFPRVQVVRGPEEDDHHYFGPFTTSGLLRQTLNLLRKVFPYRTCSDRRLRAGGRPCLHHQMGRCLAPCSGDVDPDEYGEMIDGLIRFFSGDTDGLIREIREKMERAAEELDFERAATLRDQVAALRQVSERQKMIASSAEEQDIVGLARSGELTSMTLMYMREGRIVGQDSFSIAAGSDDSDGEILAAVLREYYADVPLVPRRIEVPSLPAGAETLRQWLSARRGSRVFLHRPQRGERRRLVEMACRNAEVHLAEMEREDPSDLLAAELNLPSTPARIECYDISNLSGGAAVGSMVVFEGGMPARYAYRRFRIRDVEGPDDFAMMQEVLRRRLDRLHPSDSLVAEKDPSFAAAPDLILVDGGAGQVSVATRILQEKGRPDITVLGLAKREELIYRPGQQQPEGRRILRQPDWV
ncbi:MAG: excinuclease ABC subunit UvrC, partial [Bacillota bacterium]